MRKSILFTLGFLSFLTIYSQVPDYTLGVRFGGSINALGAEFSYQIGVSDETRLELDLGAGVNDGLTVIKVTGGYHWHGNLGGDFSWFGGPVLAAGAYNQERDLKESGYQGFFHIGAVIGIDYFFYQFPLQVSVDFRPEYPIGDSYTDGELDTGFGLGLRYILEW